MAEALSPSKTKRQVKLRSEPGFLYDTESLGFLLRRENRGNIQHQTPSSDSERPQKDSITSGKHKTATLLWSDIDLPLTNETEGINDNLRRDCTVFTEGEVSAVKKVIPASLTGAPEERQHFVNKNSWGRASSTRLDFLGSFLSVSPSEHLNSSDMSNLGDICVCTESVV